MSKIKLDDFFQGETVEFSILLQKDGTAQNITTDTVTVRVKLRRDDLDSESLIEKNADVVTSGTGGIALFELIPANTNIPINAYHLDIKWVTSAGKKYVAHDQKISVKDGVSDP